MKKNILFIINPISGGKDKTGIPQLIDKWLDGEKFNPEYVFTKYRNHGSELASGASKTKDVVVAVGGDGTINEIASALEGSNCTMGIIPCGSGNGLARTLKLSLNHQIAIQAINKAEAKTIDTAVFNGKKFFNMAGIGFDAHISHCFANLPNRGFKGYFKTALREVTVYKPKLYTIEVDGLKLERRAFMISIANSSQYGNNAHISRTASLTDGLLDVCIVKPFPLYLFPAIGCRMFLNTADRSKYVEIIKGRDIRIQSNEPGIIHLDGEPGELAAEFLISVKPLSLKVLF